LNPAQEVFPQPPDPRNNPNRCTFDLESSATSLPIPPATIRIVLCCGSPLSSHHNVNRCGIRTPSTLARARRGLCVCTGALHLAAAPPAGPRPPTAFQVSPRTAPATDTRTAFFLPHVRAASASVCGTLRVCSHTRCPAHMCIP